MVWPAATLSLKPILKLAGLNSWSSCRFALSGSASIALRSSEVVANKLPTWRRGMTSEWPGDTG